MHLTIDPGLSKYNFVNFNSYSDINGCEDQILGEV